MQIELNYFEEDSILEGGLEKRKNERRRTDN